LFKKVLIANRGAIATRIIRSLDKLGVHSIAVYNTVDAHSLHVLQASEALSLGSGNATDTYLNQDKLFAIIAQTGADAVHPGYGFLSENADFVKRCEQNGVVFIGPTIAQIQAFGLKHTARELARSQQIPLLPGTELLDSLEQALLQADSIGYPVMLKSTAGGGGIGMQLCWNKNDLADCYVSVRRLSESNFSNSGVFLEKYIEYARHIEVQIFGDGKGDAIAIGERDCSSQRRHQKVIEETPAPNITNETRSSLHATAIRLVKSIEYKNAGTVEFIYDQISKQFYFLEVNTRLQVEHGVTEEVYGIDLVEWMVKLAAEELPFLTGLSRNIKPDGVAIQARIYAENPHKNFQPSAGLLSQVEFPHKPELRIDHWIAAGIEVSAFFDPLLAKIIVKQKTREKARLALQAALRETFIYGVETNIDYVISILSHDVFVRGTIFTRFLNDFDYHPNSIDIISAGTMTTIQDYPGRRGYWNVGVPPSGPFDAYAFRLGNRLLNNDVNAAGLEITLNGPRLKFNCNTLFVLTGAKMQVRLDNAKLNFWQTYEAYKGQVLNIESLKAAGSRAYLLIKGGIQCPDYLGSKSTFTLGQFGGHSGRALCAGDVLHIKPNHTIHKTKTLAKSLSPLYQDIWDLHVIYGPHGAPDFFTPEDIESFFSSTWEVHYNSSRTGVRLIGPKPTWARRDGGEAGMHPSNIHDNAYAIGAIDFTGDMPVILGPDGPSLGGFVCPATVISADLWKLGQLKAGNKVRFICVAHDAAVELERLQDQSIAELSLREKIIKPVQPDSAIIEVIDEVINGVQVVYRASGDKYLLIEYGEAVLDIALRFRVHALMLWLQQNSPTGMLELTPGIRSLQVHYDSQVLSRENLLSLLIHAESKLKDIEDMELPARVVHLPLSWDDEACTQAIQKYMQSVRKEAPWCPSNIEFIRRINGLHSVQQVKDIVFNARYLVMGLGDVYLGAPVATPLDPRHRLVTTKYNPARTWTAENSVGIGGSYLCVYGMEGPGGYQFVGRTLQMWNRHKKTKEFEQPWLLRFFDQLCFYEVTAEELKNIRKKFPHGNYPLKISETTFKLKDYLGFLDQHQESIDAFTEQRNMAFDKELQQWIESGQINYEIAADNGVIIAEEDIIPASCIAIESPVAGSVWKVLVEQGEEVHAGRPIMVLESMKMEIEIVAPSEGKIYAITREMGAQVNAGQTLIILQEEK